MVDWEPEIAQELSTRQCVTTRARLQGLGIGRRIIDALCRRGPLTHVGNGVLVSPSGADTFEHRLALACALTKGVVTFPSAGTVWRYRKRPSTRKVHVAVVRSRAVVAVPDWIVVHRTRELTRCDVVRRSDGIVVTSPPRTVFDAAAWLDADDLESVIEQGLDRGNFTIPTLWAHARRLRRRGRAGSARFVDVLARREAWQRPVASDHELRLVRARGFPPLTRQFPLRIAPGTVIHPDLGIPDHGSFVEVDHLSWHGGRVQGAYDRWRDLKVRAVTGSEVERVTDIAIDHHLAEAVEDLWVVWQRVRARR
jgi:hypothetical protein